VVLGVEPLADLLPVAVDRSGSPSSAFVANRGTSFSGYWFGPKVFAPRVIDARTP
jgi:hypothetical protein